MKQIIFTTVFLLGLSLTTTVKAQEASSEMSSLNAEIGSLRSKQENFSKEISSLNAEIGSLKLILDQLNSKINILSENNSKAESRITILESTNNVLVSKVDSLQDENIRLQDSQKADKNELTTKIGQTNEKVLKTEDVMSSRTVWGILCIITLLVVLISTAWFLYNKFKSNNSTIDEVRKAQTSLENTQETLRKAQIKMQEESIKLDNKLVDLLSIQPIAAPATTVEGKVDHSLTLKIADEIVKIEMNLSRMDENIKGYKQLKKGVQRIKDNFNANDYEIVDMLGKPYQDGMRVVATFVTDENLEPGQQIITRVIKPQVNYKQVMIQAAQIEVSQAE